MSKADSLNVPKLQSIPLNAKNIFYLHMPKHRID